MGDTTPVPVEATTLFRFSSLILSSKRIYDAATESSQFLMSYIDGSILGYYYFLWCSRIENVVLHLSSLVSFYSFVSGKGKRKI